MPRRSRSLSRFPLLLLRLRAPVGLFGAAPTSSLSLFGYGWEPFAFLSSGMYGFGEKLGLIACLIIAVVGLGYAASLMKQVYAADTGTPAMQAVALAVREGANAYLRKQFTVVGVLIVVLTVVIVASKWPWSHGPGMHSSGELQVIALGRGLAFLGALFSAAVGFTGMRRRRGQLQWPLPRKNFGPAMRLAYRTGTITGMFTCGLGLRRHADPLVFGELAYEILWIWLRGRCRTLHGVGGGIYTKAADVPTLLAG